MLLVKKIHAGSMCTQTHIYIYIFIYLLNRYIMLHIHIALSLARIAAFSPARVELPHEI